MREFLPPKSVVLKISRFFLVTILVFSWIFSGWPQIWHNPAIPPEVQEAQAATIINVSPNAKHANDTSGEAISEITEDDAAAADYGVSKVIAGDLVYTVDRNYVMQLDTFDVSSIADVSTISAAVLHLEWGAEGGYTGTSYVRYDNGAGLTNTTIQPSDTGAWSGDVTYDLYTQGVDTKAEIGSVDIEFTNNDPAAPADAINFDYLWITVTYTVPTYTQSAYRMFNNTDTTDVGTPLAALNATSTLGSTGAAFRLRMLLHIGAADLPISGQAFKLLFAGAGANGNCASPGGTPSGYTDVTATTTIAYKNNTPADGDNLTSNSEDPTHTSDTVVDQTYEELNDFTNSVAAILATQDGKWDFALYDNGAPASTAYCFRAVKSDGTVLDTYTVYPAVITAAAASLTFTIDTNSVFIGSNTPGTPIASSSVLTVNTNNSAGYNIKINRASTTPTLFLNSYTISDTPNGNNWTAPTATSTAGPSAIWTSGATKGLGFRLNQTGTVTNTYSTAWWGTDDTSANALYSGISTSTAAQKIANTTLGSGSNENTTVEYKLDVSNTQAAGDYNSSPITFTATVN